jgi:hypothetical protein
MNGEHFPWRDVESCRVNLELQEQHSVTEARNRYVNAAHPCRGCATPPNFLSWVYFDSPPKTWASLCGRAGWLTICDWCHVQVDFFCELMN